MPNLKLIPIYLLYITTFGLAATSKLLPLFSGHVGAPEWFQKQFGGTFLNLFPGALSANFYLIAILELTVTVLFIAGLFRRKFLHPALLLAQLVFVILGFGLRISSDFHGAAELVGYFGVTLLATWYVETQSSQLNQ
jgi:hypothetical protein